MSKKISTTIVLGSGGHTTEMLKLLSATDLSKHDSLDFVVAETDPMSLQKVDQLAQSLPSHLTNRIRVTKIKRSRHVGQSYLTSIFTTLMAILYSFPLLIKLKPNFLLVNGPGTCIPICFVAFLLSLFRITPKCKIVFVESICRVKHLSLTGKLLYHFRVADVIFVQWKELNEVYKRTRYIGQLV